MKAAGGVQIAERWAQIYGILSANDDAMDAHFCTCIEELSRAEERERVLERALQRAVYLHNARARDFPPISTQIVLDAALTAAPEQPDRSVCPDCKSTTRSFRGRRGDEAVEWVCGNKWHAPEQGKEAKS